MKKFLPFLTLPLLILLVSLACGGTNEFENNTLPLESEEQEEDFQSDTIPEDTPADLVVEENTGVFEIADCPFNTDADVECGYLTVPENRSNPNSPLIELAVAILYAPEGGTEAPIIYLEGGPGGSPLAEFNAADWDFPFTRNRNLILLDQRGTGYSFPTLDCPELSEDSGFGETNPDQECQERLTGDGIDLTAYNSAENAADVEALRVALGIDEWNLLGISYGTRLALNVMRDHPEGIRSVILDSPFPPNADTPVEEWLLTYELMQNLFATCAEDSYCQEYYPDLEIVFLDTVAMLNAEPADDLTGDNFVTTISSAMQDSGLIPLIPYVIYEVYNGNLDALNEISQDGFARRHQFQGEEDRTDSEGMYNSVMCHDEYAFSDYERVESALVGQVPVEVEGGFLQASFEFFQVCSFWGAGEAGSVENMAVSSDIPTLILVGEFDTATPPQWGQLTARTLSNSYLFIYPGGGHSLLTTTDCSVNLIDEFLDDPQTEPDRTCIDSVEWPYFE